MNHLSARALSLRALRAVACSALLSLSSAQAAFTLLDLGTLPTGGFYVSTAVENLPDGRLLYGTRNSLLGQYALGSPSEVAYTAPASWDPSSIALFDGQHGVVAPGSSNTLYLFNPSNLGTPFTPVPGVSLQNYSVVFRNATTLLVAGTNGSGGQASISAVATNGSVSKVIIENAGPYSGAITLDLAGNLFVTNAATGALYKFTPAQVQAAITGAALNLANFTPLTTLKRTGSIAVDALGRIITGGYAADASFNEIPGFEVYDPVTGKTITLTPTGLNTDYVVTTFSTAEGNYIGFLDASSTPGSRVTYGYDRVENVPEPTAALLWSTGVLVLWRRRRTPFAA